MIRSRSNTVKGGVVPHMDNDRLNVLFGVWLASRAAMDLVDGVLESCVLDGDEFAVYSMLAAPPTITPTELALWMASPATTVSSVIKRLEARGHAERVPNPADGRSYRLRLTSEGRRVHRRAAALFAPALNDVVGALASSDDDVRRTLIQLRRAIDTVRSGEALRGRSTPST
ncbi:MAG: MarR family transcriptional regulator [Acidimicrobiia bacterium]